MEKDFCRYPLQLGYLKYTSLLSISPDKQFFVCNILIIFLSFSLDISFGCSKEPSQ